MACVTKSENRTHHTAIFVAALIVCAVCARVLGNRDILPAIMGLLRALLYIGLYLSWGLSVDRRILSTPVRRYMIGISTLAVFWFILRSMKYQFVVEPEAD